MINKLLYSLSSTDQELIAQCDVQSKTQQKFKGILVLIAGFLAAISAIGAMSLLTRSLFLMIVSGIAYGLIIIFFDRSIVSAARKHTALLGLLFAIVFGITTSAPLELRLFKSSIDEEISKRQMTENMQIKELENEIEQSRKKLEDLQKELIVEAEGRSGSGMVGAGPVYREKLKAYEYVKSQTELRIAQLTIEIDNIRRGTLNRSEDFLSRLVVLQDIQKTSPSALRVIWVFRIMLILAYAMPSLFILLEADTKYNFLIKKRQANIPRYESEYPSTHIANSRFSIPDFGRGFATAMDWTGMLALRVEELRGGDKTMSAADATALAGDWEAIGNDLKKVLDKHGAKAT